MTKVVGSGAAHKDSAVIVTAQQVTAAFDKAFRWSKETHALNGDNSDIKLPKTAQLKGADLKGEAKKIFADVQKNKNYSNFGAYELTLAGGKVVVLMGMNGDPPSDCGLALFNIRGKQLAFKDVMGLNQWQYDGKGNAHNMALGAGLPGAEKPKPVKPLSAVGQKVSAAFDKAFPWNNQTDSVDIPKGDELKGALPRGSQAARMAHSSTYDGVEVYKLHLAGKPVYAVIGIADATYDIGLFDFQGSRLAINGGSGWTP